MSRHVCHDQDALPRPHCSIVLRPVGHGRIVCRRKPGHVDQCKGTDCSGNDVLWSLPGRTG